MTYRLNTSKYKSTGILNLFDYDWLIFIIIIWWKTLKRSNLNIQI